MGKTKPALVLEFERRAIPLNDGTLFIAAEQTAYRWIVGDPDALDYQGLDLLYSLKAGGFIEIVAMCPAGRPKDLSVRNADRCDDQDAARWFRIHEIPVDNIPTELRPLLSHVFNADDDEPEAAIDTTNHGGNANGGGKEKFPGLWKLYQEMKAEIPAVSLDTVCKRWRKNNGTKLRALRVKYNEPTEQQLKNLRKCRNRSQHA